MSPLNTVPLDLGIMFLPKSVAVDRTTGSQYVAENGAALLQTEYIALLDQALQDESIELHLPSLSDSVHEDISAHLEGQRREYLAVAQGQDVNRATEIRQSYIKQMLERNDLYYKKATDVITSEEYWEQWFSEHEGTRPQRVVYYDGEPNDAVVQFLLSQNVIQPEEIASPYASMFSRTRLNDGRVTIPADAQIDLGVFRATELSNALLALE